MQMYVTHTETHIHGLLTASTGCDHQEKSPWCGKRVQAILIVVVVVGEGTVPWPPGADD